MEKAKYLDSVGNQYTITILEGKAGFHEIKKEWEELWEKSIDATHFQCWGWQYLYFRNLLPNAKPKILVVRNQEGCCVAIASFCKITDPVSHLIKLAFLGDLLADYHLILCLPNLPVSVGFLILDCFFKTLNQNVSIFDLSNIPQGSWTAEVISAYIQESSIPKDLLVSRKTQTYSIPLPNSFETYLEGLGPNPRRNLRADRRRLAREFTAEWQIYDEIATLEYGLAAIEVVDKACRKEDSRYYDPAKRNFQISLAQAQANAGMYLAFVLYINQIPVAYLSGVVDHKSYKANSTGYNPDFSKQLSIGRDVIFYAIEICLQRGISEFDLQRGAESYKQWLGAKPHDNLHLRLYRNRLDRGLVAIIGKTLEVIRHQTWLRRVYQRFVRGIAQ